MSRQLEKWQRLYKSEIVDHLREAQSNATSLVVCAGCGRELEVEFMELDHIFPSAEGGENWITNRILRYCCLVVVRHGAEGRYRLREQRNEARTGGTDRNRAGWDAGYRVRRDGCGDRNPNYDRDTNCDANRCTDDHAYTDRATDADSRADRNRGADAGSACCVQQEDCRSGSGCC